jgi:hypothetical protein
MESSKISIKLGFILKNKSEELDPRLIVTKK